MKSLQFAWVYLIQHGEPGQSPSFYGGLKDLPEIKERFSTIKRSWDKQKNNLYSAYLNEIALVGVDWKKTKSPKSTKEAQFAGTFEDSCDYAEYLKGQLILKNGNIQSWCVEGIDIKNVFNMMEFAEKSRALFFKIFGEED